LSEESFNNMVSSVVNEYKWSPEIIGDLFFDSEDYHGLEFWYNNVKEMNDRMKQKT
jgi:hypothetical protein